MSNHQRAPANRTAGVDRKYLEERSKGNFKMPPERRHLRGAQYAVLRRSARIMARNTTIGNQTEIIANSKASKSSNDIHEALQEINFYIRVLRLLDVEGSTANCFDRCYFCNMKFGEYDSLATLTVSELIPSVWFFEDNNRVEELGSCWLTT